MRVRLEPRELADWPGSPAGVASSISFPRSFEWQDACDGMLLIQPRQRPRRANVAAACALDRCGTRADADRRARHRLRDRDR
jgi:hypothetical protein